MKYNSKNGRCELSTRNDLGSLCNKSKKDQAIYGTCKISNTVCNCVKYITCPAVYNGIGVKTNTGGCYYEYTPSTYTTCPSGYKYNSTSKKCCK